MTDTPLPRGRMFDPLISFPRGLCEHLGLDLPPGRIPLSQILAEARRVGISSLALVEACRDWLHSQGIPIPTYDRIVQAGRLHRVPS